VANNFETQNIKIKIMVYKLFVRIIEARNLKDQEYLGKVDPFVEIQLKSSHQAFKTNVVKNKIDPIWNLDCSFTVISPSDSLCFKVYDFDKFMLNDLIGEVEVPLHTYLNQGVKDFWVPLEHTSINLFKLHTAKKIQGQLHIQLDFTGDSSQGVEPYPQTKPQTTYHQQQQPSQIPIQGQTQQTGYAPQQGLQQTFTQQNPQQGLQQQTFQQNPQQGFQQSETH